jgi:predicted deacylase
VPIPRGETRDVRLKISETYTGNEVAIPIRVIRALKPGPTMFISAAVHGDELNGTGIIHDLIYGSSLDIHSGALLLIPVVNVLGFEQQQRYLPDRRDLNRCFPGSPTGSLTSRYADVFLKEIIQKCNYGIDLHTAASYRTNFPNIRGDLSIPEVKKLADSFGCELIVDGKGPVGSLRREACKAGCPTIILEAGEPFKLEPSILETGVRGIRNVLIGLGMLAGTVIEPPYQVHVRKTTWLRAEVGGIIRFHVGLGDLVEEGQAIASNFSILGQQQNTLHSSVNGVVLGLTTMPAIKPGEPVCHLAVISQRIKAIRRAISDMGPKDLHQRVRDHLATNISGMDSTEDV